MLELKDMISFKKGDPVKIKIKYPRLRWDKKYNNMTGQIVDTIEVGSVGGRTVVTDYVVYLHRKRELCAFSDSELELNDDQIMKERIDEVKKKLNNFSQDEKK